MTIEEIAREAAAQIIKTAQYQGYEIKSARSMFSVSDIGNLENDIVIWLEEHMEKPA